MADPAPQFFKQFTIAVHSDDLAGVLRKCTLPQRVADAGGRLIFWEDGQKENYTHVIARNSQKPLAVWARDNGKTIVSLLWVWDCLEAGRLLPIEEEQLYSLDFRIPPAHSTQEITITATGYSGIQRHIYLQMLETAGMKVVKEMHPFETTHILAANVHDKSSGKIKRALLPDVASKIRIVNVLWLYDCLRQGCILPTGGYERNPPQDMDPAKGALAIDARLQTVAASDSSEGSPSQSGEPSGQPASRSAAPQVPETVGTASAANAPGQRHGEARDQQDTSAATATDLEQRRRAIPSVTGFQPQHLDKQQAPRSAAAQQHADQPEPDPMEECSPQQLPGNGWRQRKKSLKPGSGRSARPLADVANSSPALPDIAAGAARPPASKSSVPSGTAHRESTPAHAAQAQPRVQAQQLGTTAQAQLDPKRRPAAQQRTQEPQPPTTELGDPGKAAGPGAQAGRLQQAAPGTDSNRLPAHSSPDLPGARERAEAARQRLPAAAAGCGPARVAEDLCCSQPDSCANMSERVAGAEAAVARLVDQVGASESVAGLGADDETDSELDATVADSGKRRQQPTAATDGSSMQQPEVAPAGKAQPPSRKQQPVAGSNCNKRLCAAVKERSALPAWIADQGPEQQRPEQVEHASQADRRVPVNLDAPLASQADQEMQEDGNLEAVDARGPRLQASQGHKGTPQDGVLWRALPIIRAARSLEAPGSGRQRPGRGVKRSSAAPRQDPLIGRRLRKAFQDRTYEGRVESRDAGAGYFRVVYEDDDSEEMSLAQLEPLLLPDGDDQDAESPPAAAPAAKQPGPTAAVALPPPEAGGGAAKGRTAKRSSKRQAVVDAPGGNSAEHADKRRKSSRAAAQPAAAEQASGRGRQPALGDANGQLPSASKRRQGEEAPEGAVQAGKRKRAENDHRGSKRTKAAPMEATNQAAMTKAPAKRTIGRGATPAAEAARKAVKRRPVFAVSSMHTDERDEAAEALRSLKVGVSVDLHSHQWDSRITHLLLPGDWVRGAKVLAAMAAGSWLLSTDYLAACTKNQALLEEDDYEIATNSKNTVSRRSPRHWRLRRTLHGQAAFQGLKVVVHGEFEEGLRPRRDEVVSILQAGGANLLTLNQGLSLGVHFVVTKASRPKTDAKVKQLLGAGLCLVSPHFVVDWIAHPWTTPSKHTLHGSRMGSDLTAAAKARGELQA